MLSRLSRLATVVAAVVAVIPASSASAATLWTPVSTGTTNTISAIAWPTANTLVFATSAGHIFHETGPGAFAQSTVTPAAPLGFTDVAMSSDGTKGVAVGHSGALYHSADSGATWTAVPAVADFGACGQLYTPSIPLTDDLYSAHFADANTVYVTGANDDILRSTDGGAHFGEINKSDVSNNVACKVNGNHEAVGDTAWIDANHGFFLSTYFGDLFSTTDGLASAVGTFKSEALNSYGVQDRLALDSADPSRMWAVSPFPACGTLCFVGSTDGGTTFNSVTYDGHQNGLQDIADSGTTVVAAGNGGDIYTSPDGKNFFRQVAPGALATNDWNSVAVLNSTTAAVGGANGALVVTSTANAVPDTTAPTGTISGPTKLTTGAFGPYTASAQDNAGGSGVDASSFSWSIPGQAAQTGSHVTFGFSNPGTYTVTVSFKDFAGNAGTATISITVTAPAPSGSQPVTKTSGGSTITIFKKVTVTGTSGRYIPVKLATKKPRQFIITLLSKTGNHQLATLTTKLKKGKKTVHLKVPAKIKPGTYKLVVIVLTVGKHSHPVGGRIKQVFVLS